MENSRFLAKAIGLYLVIVALAFYFNMTQYTSYVVDLINNSALMLVTGLMTLIIGILLVVSHNVWQLSWRLIITLIGWATLLKAVCLLFCPESMSQTNLQMMQSATVMYASIIIDLILGVILLFFGFRKSSY
jgi:hypothetical protein